MYLPFPHLWPQLYTDFTTTKYHQPRTENSPKRERSSSPMDMETSSESEEDGQITKYDEQEERERRLYGSQANNSKGTNGAVEDDIPITMEDLNSVCLSRDLLAKYCLAPWFEEYVKGLQFFFELS